MLFSDICTSYGDASQRKKIIQERRLDMLKYFRDSLERKLAATNASIDTLQDQIDRDKVS